MNSWPVIVPPGPGVLCAYGDVTTRIRNEASRTFIRRFPDTSSEELVTILEQLAENASQSLEEENVPREERTSSYQVDVRYHGQGLSLTIEVDLDELRSKGLDVIADEYDQRHEQLFTFALDADKEVVNVRAVVQGEAMVVKAPLIEAGDKDASAAIMSTETIFVDGCDQEAHIYDRSRIKAGNRIAGPAIVVEMDATTLILPGHTGEVDKLGNILIRPDEK